MDENSKVTGLAVGLKWEHGYPTKAEFDLVMGRTDAVVKVARADGGYHAIMPLRVVPILPLCEKEDHPFPGGIRAGDIVRWEVPVEVAILRLTIEGEGFQYIDMDFVRQLEEEMQGGSS